MLKHIVFAAVLVCVPAHAQDRWIAQDKLEHGFVSMGIGGLSGSLIESKVWAGAACITPGVLKEYHDRRVGGDFSYKDLTWDALGCAAGIGWVRLARSQSGQPMVAVSVPLK